MGSDHHTFKTNIAIRFADMDANGHVFFGTYLTYFDTAFLAYLDAVDYGFNRFIDQGLNLYYAEALARYKGAVRFGQTLTVEVRISHFGATSFTIEFTLFSDLSNKPINAGHIVAVVVGMQTERPTAIPPDFIARIREFQQS